MYIVQEENKDEPDQDGLFVSAPSIEKKAPRKLSDSFEAVAKDHDFEELENPFEDTMANSQMPPETKPLDLHIEENYIAKPSTHEQNLSKRKRKKQNLSMHQLDAATQESIQATIASERGHMDDRVED